MTRLGTPLHLLSCAIAACSIAFAMPARASTDRYSVIIGHNSGAAGEQTLRYAESDAQRFADLLGDIGGVHSENQVVLRGKTADEVRRAMIATNERIRTDARSGHDSVLFVYYSGHGDADALHLGDSRLPLRELEALVRGSPAAVRVLVIDSCRSGSITRVKGGTSAPPLALAAASPLAGEGMIVLTASTLSEDAQESDDLGGSFFTHYLISGLRGAADENGDRMVTVGEAFSYTREQTIVASSRTLAGTQHPTFQYDLRGRADLALADLGDAAAHGELTLPAGATWLVMRTVPSRSVVGEIAPDAARRTFSLVPGSYAIRGRTRDALLEGTANVAVGARTTVDEHKLTRTTYAALVRKGNGEILRSVSGPFAAFSSQAEPFYSRLRVPTGPYPVPQAFFGPMFGWTWVGPALTLSPRVSIAWNHDLRHPAETFPPPEYSIRGTWRGRMITVDLRAARAWQFGRWSLDAGFVLGGGGHRFWEHVVQRFPGIPEQTYDVSYYSKVVHLDVSLGGSVALWGRSYLGLEVAGQSYIPFNEVDFEHLELIAVNTFLGFWL